MSEISLLDHQREASDAARVLSRIPEIPVEAQPWGQEAQALEAAGWHHKVRLGRRIWCEDPDDPWSFWRSEKQAYRMIQEEAEE